MKLMLQKFAGETVLQLYCKKKALENLLASQALIVLKNHWKTRDVGKKQTVEMSLAAVERVGKSIEGDGKCDQSVGDSLVTHGQQVAQVMEKHW